MEAHIVINGTTLNEAQSMTVRVAVSSMRMELSDPEQCAKLGPIAEGYKNRLSELEEILLSHQG